jgi:hypothetical protein
MWFCFGIAAFLALVGMVTIVGIAVAPSSRGDAVGFALLFGVIVGLPAAFIFKLANDLRRTRIVLTDRGVDLRVSRFRIWAFRRLGVARLAWPDIRGVQRYDIPNFAAPTGVQTDYVLHTTEGVFAVSSIQFAEAERIGTLIAERIGRAVDDLPAGVTPVSAADPAGRRGVRAMRALGWIAQAMGVVFPVLMLLAWLGGSSLEAGTIGGVAVTGGVLLMIGRALRRFALK